MKYIRMTVYAKDHGGEIERDIYFADEVARKRFQVQMEAIGVVCTCVEVSREEYLASLDG